MSDSIIGKLPLKLKERVNALTGPLQKTAHQIRLLSDKIERIKRPIEQHIRQAIGSTEQKHLRTVAVVIYWMDESYGTIVRNVCLELKIKLDDMSHDFFLPCRWCHDPDISFTVSSWSEYRKKIKHYKQKTYEWKHISRLLPFLCQNCVINVQEMKQQHESEKQEEQEEINEEWTERKESEKQQLHHLKTMPYSEYLKTSHWQSVRLRALKRAGYRCQLCNAKQPLDVHHRTYERRGCEWNDDLIAICRSCHDKHHDVLPEEDQD